MAVNWYWKHKVGEIIFQQLEPEKAKWKLEMFGGNMMCCFIYRYKNEEGEKMYNFFMWYNDMNHAKRCLKDTRLEDYPLGKHKVLKVRLCITSKDYKYSNREMLQLAKLLTNMGYKVELY